MWSRDPFRRSSPRGVPFATGNPGTAGSDDYPRHAPRRQRSRCRRRPTRSGASSARGASTKRRSRHRGWGTVRSGSSSVIPSIQMTSASRRPGPPPHGAHPAGGRLQAVALLEQPVGVDGVGHGQLDHQVQERPLVLGPPDGLGLVHLGHGGDRRVAAGPELVDRPAQVGASGPRGWTRARGRPVGSVPPPTGAVTGGGPPARPRCRCPRPGAAAACGGRPSPR